MFENNVWLHTWICRHLKFKHNIYVKNLVCLDVFLYARVSMCAEVCVRLWTWGPNYANIAGQEPHDRTHVHALAVLFWDALEASFILQRMPFNYRRKLESL